MEPPRIDTPTALAPEFFDAVVHWRSVLSAAVLASGRQVRILETIRTPERQDWLYASGRTRPGMIVTALRGNDPRANHVYPHGEGRAFDFAFSAPGLGLWDESHPWELAGVLGEWLGMRWGGRWASRDLGHLEWPDAQIRHVVRRGAQGAVVRRLQDALTMRGFEPGPVDGIYGPATERAVRAFEAAAGMQVDGEVDAAVALQLGVVLR
jgi:peptidoglycan L-alanyl-D-glutamate endopeptidase CwlK